MVVAWVVDSRCKSTACPRENLLGWCSRDKLVRDATPQFTFRYRGVDGKSWSESSIAPHRDSNPRSHALRFRRS